MRPKLPHPEPSATAALRDEARQAAENALALQPKLGEAILAKGFYPYCVFERLRYGGALPRAGTPNPPQQQPHSGIARLT